MGGCELFGPLFVFIFIGAMFYAFWHAISKATQEGLAGPSAPHLPPNLADISAELASLDLLLDSVGERALFFKGSFQGRPIRVVVEPERPSRIRATLLAPFPFSGAIRRQSQMTDLRTSHGLGSDIQLGVADLDQAFELDVPDTPQVRALLADPNVSEALRALRDNPFVWTYFEEISFTPTAVTAKWSAPVGELANTLTQVLVILERLVRAAAASDSGTQAPASPPEASTEGAVASAPAEPPEPAPAPTAGTSPGAPTPPPAPETPRPERDTAELTSRAPQPSGQQATPSQPAAPGPPGPEVGPQTAAGKTPGTVTVPTAAQASVSPSAAGTEQARDVPSLLKAGDVDRAVELARVDPEVLSQLVSCLGDFTLRSRATEALRALGAAAVPALLASASDVLVQSAIREVLADPAPETRAALAEALRREQDERKLEFLLELADRLRLAEARDRVAELAQHPNFLLRMKAETALRSLDSTL